MPIAVDRPTAGASPRAHKTANHSRPSQAPPADDESYIRLHITPFSAALTKLYLAPAILSSARNISYHTVETFPEKGFGYVELPAMEAKKLKKKLNGSTLKGSKVRIEEAKPEKRKSRVTEEAAEEAGLDRPAKRAKKDKSRLKQGVIEGAILPNERKVKRGWTEVPVKSKKERREKGENVTKSKQKDSKYTKEPELLFKAKLTPVAATEVARKEKRKKEKKEKKEKKNKSKHETVVHEFENNTKQPSFIKASSTPLIKKEAAEYVNGKGWVDEDGNVVEAETGKARNRRVLELVDSAEPVQPTTEKHKSLTPSPGSSPAPKHKKNTKRAKQLTPPPGPSSDESDAEESSAVSSSSDEENSSDEEDGSRAAATPMPAEVKFSHEINLTPPSPATTEPKAVHPLEALFKRSKPNLTLTSTSTPIKTGLAPINTSFSFFENNTSSDNGVPIDTGNASGNPPVTPYTQRDLEWRGLRSAAPTPDTAAVGRRFSFPWRNGSQEMDDDDDDDLIAGTRDEEAEAAAEQQLSNNTKANAGASAQLADVAEEEDEEDEGEEDMADAVMPADVTKKGSTLQSKRAHGEGDAEKPESEFRKWFWENQGNLNRAWKKRRRDALKSKRLSENKRAMGGSRLA